MSDDVVYLVRPGEENEELRYSLRSLEANYPESRVVFVGHKPKWVKGVDLIEGNLAGNPHANVYQNIQAACWAGPCDLTDDIVIMNDDFYFTEPVSGIPTWYRETLDEHLSNRYVRLHGGWWKESLEVTKICLQAIGVETPLSYELHIPVRIDRHLMGVVLEQFGLVNPHNPPQWRSLYGNVAEVQAEQHEDCKAYGRSEMKYPFMSTDDSGWDRSGREIRAMFPNKSRYEV